MGAKAGAGDGGRGGRCIARRLLAALTRVGVGAAEEAWDWVVEGGAAPRAVKAGAVPEVVGMVVGLGRRGLKEGGSARERWRPCGLAPWRQGSEQ